MIVTLFIPLAIARYSFATNLTLEQIRYLMTESPAPAPVCALQLCV
jgi:hypothetical protein